jgi:hypothetical protein
MILLTMYGRCPLSRCMRYGPTLSTLTCSRRRPACVLAASLTRVSYAGGATIALRRSPTDSPGRANYKQEDSFGRKNETLVERKRREKAEKKAERGKVRQR